jgi:hypothetical protein
MAKIDFVKYIALGAGAVAVPALVGNMAFLSSVGFLDYAVYAGITVKGILLAAVGAGVVDHFFYGK